MARKTIQAGMGGGLQIRRAEHRIPAGDFIELLDANLEADGAVGVRHGYREYRQPVEGVVPTGIFYRGDELCLVTQDTLYSWSPATETWVSRGPLSLGRLREHAIARSGFRQVNWDLDELGSSLFIVYLQDLASPGSFFSVFDRDTFGSFVGPLSLGTGTTAPRVTAADSWIFVSWFLSTRVQYSRYSPGGISLPAGTDVNNVTSSGYDCVATDRDTVLVATVQSGEAVVDEISESSVLQTVVQSSGTGTSGTDTVGLCMTPLTPGAYCCLVALERTQPDTLKVRWLDGSLALVAEATAIVTGFGGFLGSTYAPGVVEKSRNTVYCTYSNQIDTNNSDRDRIQLLVSNLASGAASFTPSTARNSARAYAHPVRLEDGRVMQMITQTDSSDLERSSVSSSHMVIDWDSNTVVSRGAGLGAGFAGVAFSTDVISRPVQNGSSVRFLGPYYEPPGDIGGGLANPTSFLILHEADFTSMPVASATVQDVAYIPGAGFMWGYDGSTVFEADFHQVPWHLEVTQTAGPRFASGETYSWALLWEWSDVAGRVYRSAPKVLSYTVGPASADSINIRVLTLANTSRDDVRLIVGRTRESLSGDPLFYRVDNLLIPLFNDVAADTIDFIDDSDDADIQTREVLRQVGPGPVSSLRPTPATDFVALSGGRLWFGDPYRANVIRFSRPLSLGFGVELGPVFAVQLDTEHRATAVTSQDRTIFGFTSETVHYWGGDGPDAGGGGPQFSAPARMPMEIGAASQNVITLTPLGIVYVSSEGPRVVGRDRSGPKVFAGINEAWKFLGQRSVAAVFRPLQNDILFFDDGPNFREEDLWRQKRLTIRYHVGSQRACHDTRHQAIDAAVAQCSELSFVRIDGRICVANRGHLDGAMPVKARGATAWLRSGESLTQNQVFSTINLVGQYLSGHEIDIGLLKNYGHTDSNQVFDFTPRTQMDPARGELRERPATWQDDTGDPYVLRWQIAPLRAYSLSVTFLVEPLEMAEPVSLVGVEVEVEVDRGLMPLDPRRVY